MVQQLFAYIIQCLYIVPLHYGLPPVLDPNELLFFSCSSVKGWGQIKVQLKVKTVSELVSLSSLVCYNLLHEYYQQKNTRK
jgi:hypothetical protein